MDTDPPTDALAAAIGHGNEVAGLNNDGGKSAGEEPNEDEGEASDEEAILTNPNPKRIYNIFGFRKRKRCLSRHKKGQQKQKNMTSQPAGLLLVFITSMPHRLLLPLWVTTNSDTSTVVLQK